MQIVVSSPKDGKAYQKKIEDSKIFLQKKIGEEVILDEIGMEGYKVKIAGGSDKDGFPMKADLDGSQRKVVYIYTDKKNGIRERKTRRGNTVDKDIHQLNVVVLNYGSKSLEELMPMQEKKDEGSLKEKMIQESAEAATKMTAEEAKRLQKEIKQKK